MDSENNGFWPVSRDFVSEAAYLKLGHSLCFGQAEETP